MARTMQGVVCSDKADKTIVIKVVARKTHPIYKKQYSETKKFSAHDEKNEARIGDLVMIQECRPISKTKQWTLNKVIKTASLADKEGAEL